MAHTRQESSGKEDNSSDNGLIVRTRDPRVVKMEKIKRMERNLGLLRTERLPIAGAAATT
jgi:hypothetical protein